MSTNTRPALARERDDHADLESADAALGSSGSFSDAFVAEIRERARTPRSENLGLDEAVADVMATIDSYRN